MDGNRPAFMGSSFSTEDARSSGPPQNPRVSEVNRVEEMRLSSALDGVTVSDPGFVDVSMIEEVYAMTTRKANRSGPDSDDSDTRTSEKVAQNVQPDQPAVKVIADAVTEFPVAKPSSTQRVPVAGPSGPPTLERPRAVAYSQKQPVAEFMGQTKLETEEKGGEEEKAAGDAEDEKADP